MATGKNVVVHRIVQILTPLYNEEKCFDTYVETVERVLLSRQDVEYRCLLVDDGSTDGTWELIQQQCRASRGSVVYVSRGILERTRRKPLDLTSAMQMLLLSFRPTCKTRQKPSLLS